MLTFFFTSLAGLSTLSGGLLAIFARRQVHLLMGLGAGVLLGAVFFDLLPESLQLAVRPLNQRIALGTVLAGFVLFYLTERVIVLHACPEGDCENAAHRHMGRMGAFGLIIHSTLDGAAIGAAALVNWQTGLLIAMAVILHDLSDGLNTILLVTRGEVARRTDIGFLIADAAAPVLGGLLATILLPPAPVLAVFLAIASGFFLYTATSDLLPQAHRKSPSISVAVATIIGIMLMGIAVRLVQG